MARRILITVLVISGCAIAFHCLSVVVCATRHYEYTRLSPPDDVTSIGDFASRMPTPKRLAVVTEAEQDYLVWVGEMAWLTLPAGPSCYLFSDNGMLLRWCPETGDGDPLTEYVNKAYTTESISVDDAVARMNHR